MDTALENPRSDFSLGTIAEESEVCIYQAMQVAPLEFLEVIRGTQDRAERIEKLYFERGPIGPKNIEGTIFSIKALVARHFACPFRNVVICGSAQLGFSPTKLTTFSPGASDLDLAIIDPVVFQDVWRHLLISTRGFSDQSKFGAGTLAVERISRIKDMLSRRGVIHFDDLPRTHSFAQARSFLRGISATHTQHFERVSVSFYMSEYAFVWKQDASIQPFVRDNWKTI